MEKAKEVLYAIVCALVDYPNAVVIDAKTDEIGVLLILHVDPSDMGKVIGKAGNMAIAIRTIIRSIGVKEKAHINLKIDEPEGGRFKSNYAANRTSAQGY